MAIPVHNLASLAQARPLPQSAVTAGKQGDQFTQVFSKLLDGVNQPHVEADQAFQQLVTGESDSVHGVVLSMAKADLSFRLMLEIRNRLVESYQEIMRMQV